jgi:hypothetical protein
MAKRQTSPSTRITDDQMERELRALDAQFARKLRALTKQLGRGPQSGKALERFARRQFVQVEALLHVWRRRQFEIFCECCVRNPHLLKRGRGRPRTLGANEATSIATGLRLPKPQGRPRRYDKPAILGWVNAHKDETGGTLDVVALCEGIVEWLKTHEPAKYRQVERRRQYYLADGRAPAHALCQAVRDFEGAHLKTLTVVLSNARHGR